MIDGSRGLETTLLLTSIPYSNIIYIITDTVYERYDEEDNDTGDGSDERGESWE
jgi:hypothetical protein